MVACTICPPMAKEPVACNVAANCANSRSTAPARPSPLQRLAERPDLVGV
jgi:hypothetical protein